MSQHLRAAVIGAGYLGRFHAEKYAALEDCELRAVVDIDAARARELAGSLGAPAATDYHAVLNDVDVASIVVPTEIHYEVARACLEAGVHILVEKPVTRTVEEASELVELAARRGLVFQVGHLERFNPAILAVRDQITRPLFMESDRLAIFKPRGIDVNVVLDLMIHDIDLILSFVRSDIASVRASVSSKANWYASDSVTWRSRFASAAPRKPLVRKWVKNEPPMRSDSCAASSAELEVTKACPAARRRCSGRAGAGRSSPSACGRRRRRCPRCRCHGARRSRRSPRVRGRARRASRTSRPVA